MNLFLSLKLQNLFIQLFLIIPFLNGAYHSLESKKQKIILVGTMLDIGFSRLPASVMDDALLSGDRKAAGATAPAHGLLLDRVCYEDFDTEEVLSRA